jgi:amino acid transporter
LHSAFKQEDVMSSHQGSIAGSQGEGDSAQLRRALDWRGAFWIASGVPALVLFSIGGIAGTTGNVAFMIWTVSMIIGLLMSFTFAELAGLFPNKSGGASVYGAAAWVKYSKFVAPLSVWCNWVAWTPAIALGCSIAAAYVLNAIAPLPGADSPDVVAWVQANAGSVAADSPRVSEWLAANAGQTPDAAINALLTADAIAALSPAIRNWTLFAHQLGPVQVSMNATFFIGAALLLIAFMIQDRGVLSTARVQKVIGLVVVVPMAVVAVVPWLTGQIDWGHFTPFVPLAVPYVPGPGAWNVGGWTLVLGGLFIAAWSTYAFETTVCYTREFKNPGTDTPKAIFFSGLLCLALFSLVPFTFQGVLGLEGMLAPSIVDGSGVAEAMGKMLGGNMVITEVFVFLMILALMCFLMTAMAGSSRTLYQASLDGWLPRYLSHVNEHGAPTKAMWTDFVFNLLILSIASADATSFFFILAVSNVCYLLCTFLYMNAGWIHRIDSGDIHRPYKAPDFMLAIGIVLAFVNIGLVGAGAKVWNPWALWAGLITAGLIIPVFMFRHYVQDGGRFPDRMLEDLNLHGDYAASRKAGWLPYATLLAGLAVMLWANWFFVMG